MVWIRCSLCLLSLLFAGAQGQSPMMHTVMVNGAGTFLDGHYEPSEVKVTGRRCYQKIAEDVFLCMSPAGHWILQPEAKVGTDIGYMISSKRYSDAPLNVEPWSLYQGSKWVEHPKITVVADVKAISTTIAMMGIGSLLIIAFIVKLALAGRPIIRETMYFVLCATITTFIAFMVLKATRHVLPVGALVVELLLGILFFTLSSAFMNYGAWKCQYNFHRVAGVCWLTAFCAAYAGIFAATAAQELVMRACQKDLSSVVRTEWAELIGMVLTAVCTIGLLAIVRWAAQGWREKSMKSDPPVLWCSKKFLTKREGCWPFGTSKDEPADAKFEWKDFVKWGEDIVGILVGSYVVYQSILFAWVDKVTQVETSVYLAGDDIHNFLFATATAAVLIAIASAVAFVADLDSRARLLRIFVLSLAMMGSWACYRLINFVVTFLFPDSELAPAALAFAVTLVSIILIAIIGVATKGPDSGAGVCALGIGIGNACGIAWGHLFDLTVHAVAGSLTGVAGLEEYSVGAKVVRILTVAALVAVVGLAWWLELLPRRNLLVDHHASMIKMEHDSFNVE